VVNLLLDGKRTPTLKQGPPSIKLKYNGIPSRRECKHLAFATQASGGAKAKTKLGLRFDEGASNAFTIKKAGGFLGQKKMPSYSAPLVGWDNRRRTVPQRKSKSEAGNTTAGNVAEGGKNDSKHA